jgi:hypothetical protein
MPALPSAEPPRLPNAAKPMRFQVFQPQVAPCLAVSSDGSQVWLVELCGALWRGDFATKRWTKLRTAPPRSHGFFLHDAKFQTYALGHRGGAHDGIALWHAGRWTDIASQAGEHLISAHVENDVLRALVVSGEPALLEIPLPLTTTRTRRPLDLPEPRPVTVRWFDEGQFAVLSSDHEEYVRTMSLSLHRPDGGALWDAPLEGETIIDPAFVAMASHEHHLVVSWRPGSELQLDHYDEDAQVSSSTTFSVDSSASLNHRGDLAVRTGGRVQSHWHEGSRAHRTMSSEPIVTVVESQ